MIVDILTNNVDKDRIDLIIKPETTFEEDILNKHKSEILKKHLSFSIYASAENKSLCLTTTK